MKRSVIGITLAILLALTALAGADWRDAELASILVQSCEGKRPKIIRENLARITSNFFESVKAEIRFLCIRGERHKAHEYWKVLRLTQAAVEADPLVFIVKCNFKNQAWQGVDPETFVEPIPAPPTESWEQLASAEFAFSCGEFHRAEANFRALLATGFNPKVCQEYLTLIDRERSRYGDL